VKRLAKETELLEETSRLGQSSTASNGRPEPSNNNEPGDRDETIICVANDDHVKSEATSMHMRRVGFITKVQGHQTYMFADINVPICLGLPDQPRLLYVLEVWSKWASEYPEAEQCDKALQEILIWVKSVRTCMDESPLKRHLGIWSLYGQGVAVRGYGIVSLVGWRGNQWVVGRGDEQRLVDDAEMTG
jgi:hypothetical protein